ncbi:MAG: hypothetical protein K0S33_3168 [Bacteroidetes bacterium]|jgi:hypothetical protein|nr:hypothetical protein [Bacteroidota bacterium]
MENDPKSKTDGPSDEEIRRLQQFIDSGGLKKMAKHSSRMFWMSIVLTLCLVILTILLTVFM